MGDGVYLHDRHCLLHVISNALSRCPARSRPRKLHCFLAANRESTSAELLPSTTVSRRCLFRRLSQGPNRGGTEFRSERNVESRLWIFNPVVLKQCQPRQADSSKVVGKHREARRGGLPRSHPADGCQKAKTRVGDWSCCKSRNNTRTPARGISALITVSRGPPRATAGNESSGKPPAPKRVWRQEPSRTRPTIFS